MPGRGYPTLSRRRGVSAGTGMSGGEAAASCSSPPPRPILAPWGSFGDAGDPRIPDRRAAPGWPLLPRQRRRPGRLEADPLARGGGGAGARRHPADDRRPERDAPAAGGSRADRARAARRRSPRTKSTACAVAAHLRSRPERQVARALIVGCGCRGRSLGVQLVERGWAVRGTSRTESGLAEIAAAGIEPALADPERPGTVLDLVGDVAVVAWLLGSAVGRGRGGCRDPRPASGGACSGASSTRRSAASSTRRPGRSRRRCWRAGGRSCGRRRGRGGSRSRSSPPTPPTRGAGRGRWPQRRSGSPGRKSAVDRPGPSPEYRGAPAIPKD